MLTKRTRQPPRVLSLPTLTLHIFKLQITILRLCVQCASMYYKFCVEKMALRQKMSPKNIGASCRRGTFLVGNWIAAFKWSTVAAFAAKKLLRLTLSPSPWVRPLNSCMKDELKRSTREGSFWDRAEGAKRSNDDTRKAERLETGAVFVFDKETGANYSYNSGRNNESHCISINSLRHPDTNAKKENIASAQATAETRRSTFADLPSKWPVIGLRHSVLKNDSLEYPKTLKKSGSIV